ncbi:MAG TPA: hypothetical protein VL404_01980 [Candidatus Eisenbacteria bacterium]|nr:hypothetical protein [Candidatus Eisenbacteria bacterium]
MKKAAVLAALVFLAWPVVLFAGEEEDLGVVMKNKNADSAEGAVGKSRALAGKYDRAKQRVADALGVDGPQTPSDPEEPAPKSAPTPPPAPPKAPQGADTVHLANGQTIAHAKIVREDAGGLTLDMDGTEVFFSKAEVKSVERAAS